MKMYRYTLSFVVEFEEEEHLVIQENLEGSPEDFTEFAAKLVGYSTDISLTVEEPGFHPEV